MYIYFEGGGEGGGGLNTVLGLSNKFLDIFLFNKVNYLTMVLSEAYSWGLWRLRPLLDK